MKGSSLVSVALAGLLGCVPPAEEETTTTSSTSGATTTDGGTATTTAPMTTTGLATEGATDHGLTWNDDGSTGDDCELFEYTEVEGCEAPVGEQFCSEGSAHLEVGTEIEWENNPPHSGPHWPMWQLWGEHESTVEREYWVHNLEHGGIVLAYRCPGGCEADLEVLRTVMSMRPELRILLTPDPELPSDGFAAVSWTWVHSFETPDLDTLLCFVDQHENHAPENVP